MANVAKNAILRAKLGGVLTELLPKTITDNVYVNETTTLTAYLATLAVGSDLEQLQAAVDALGALAKKDKISQSDLDDALAAVINAKAEQSALTEEINRAKAAEEANAAAAAAAQDAAEAAQADVDEVSGKVTTLIGADTGKSVRTIANEELAAQLIGENASEALDTLEEIAKWIQDHPGDAAAMNAAITALQNKLSGIDEGEGTVKKYVDDAITALKIGDYAKAADLTELAGRVTTAEGKITILEGVATGLGDLAVLDEVGEDNLSAGLLEKVNASAEGNHSHANKAELDKIAEGDKAKWDAAEQNAKDYADGLNTAMDGRVQVVEGKAHEHANKDVLDGISADLVSAWNGKANIYYSATEPENMAEGDLWVQLVD